MLFRTYFFTALLLMVTLINCDRAIAIDFDLDGFDDFVVIQVQNKNRLEWFALDLNDNGYRALGQFGRLGDHLAVGNWSGDARASKGYINKKSSGEFEWRIALPEGQRGIMLGTYPDLVISGLDIDRNAAIDPTVVQRGQKNLIWKVMYNPGTSSAPPLYEIPFGGKRDTPFFANLDGTGDQIATAKVDAKGLSMRFLNLRNGKSRKLNVPNHRSKIFRILPVARANGIDSIYAVSKRGKKLGISLIKGKKISKRFNINGDEVVVGKYLGNGLEVLAVRSKGGKVVFLDANGKRTSVNISLTGILVDEINVNSFSKTTVKPPKNNNPSPPASPAPPGHEQPRNPGSSPVCAGLADSREHLLYKPVSDSNGNVVLVFDSKYSREFLSVRLELRNGSFTDAWWKPLVLWGNPDAGGPRQHWRTNVRSSEVKDGALIIVDDTTQECRFQIPGSSRQRWE